MVEDQNLGILLQIKSMIILVLKKKKLMSLKKWAEEESQKDAGYSEEHIKQMTTTKHNQWGVAGEPKKMGYIDTRWLDSSILAHPGSVFLARKVNKNTLFTGA